MRIYYCISCSRYAALDTAGRCLACADGELVRLAGGAPCPACALARAQVEPLEARVAELEATLAIVERLHAEVLAQLRAREARDAHMRSLVGCSPATAERLPPAIDRDPRGVPLRWPGDAP